MPFQPVERRRTAIFARCSQLMARDEIGTLSWQNACRAIIDWLIASHRGRIFNTAGDRVVAGFARSGPVQCAVSAQAAIATENAGGAADEPTEFLVVVPPT